MSINYSLKKLLAVVVAAAAVAVAVLAGAHGAFAGDSGQSTRGAHNGGYPNAVPPILPRESASQLAALEAWEAVEFYSDPPPNAPYSNAEMNAYGTVHK